MSQPARKPGEGGKVTESLSTDDPSIPVLTERLTLPPLDLDLDFRLPARPGQASEKTPVAPEVRPVQFDDEATRYAPLDETRYAPLEDEATRLSIETRRAFEPTGYEPEPTRAPQLPPAAAPSMEGPVTGSGFGTREPDTRSAPVTRTGADTRTAVDTRGSPATRSGVEARRADTAAAPDTRRDTRGGPDTHRGPDTRGPDTRSGPTTHRGPQTEAPAAEHPDAEQRVPTSLLVSNLNAMMATPAPTHRRPQQDDFDLTITDGGQGISELDTELRERILLDLARRLPTEVDTIVRRHLETAIDEAVRRFAAEVRIALAGSLREIVDRAVKAELARLKNPRS